MERVLITGGAGFIGSYLSERFLKEGFRVICMDNLLTGSLDNISHLFENEHFTFVKQDVTNFIHVEGKLEYILHFASPASPIDYLKLPIPTLKVGSLGTHKVLGLARVKKATVLLASTSEVYGDPLVHPQREEYWGNVNPIGPRGVYDEAKRFAEAITMAYHRVHGVETRIARIFNTFGPRMRVDDGRLIPTFLTQALKGEDLTVFGNGTQTRSFCFITDMAEGLFRLLMKGDSNPVNLGNPREMTVADMGRLILTMTGSKSAMSFHPLPENDPKVRQPDISLANKLLGWSPVVEVEDGLKETVTYFRKKLGLESTVET